MSKRVLLATVLSVAAAASALAAVAFGAMVQDTYNTKLSGKSEVPKGDPNGSGTARVTVNRKTNKVCWTFTLKSVEGPAAAHIHKGKPGKAGPVVVPLGGKFAKTGCTKTSKSNVKAIQASPKGFYVNVHSKKFASGAVRGQL